MTVSREFLYQLPIAFSALLLATVVLVRASAPPANEPISIATLHVADAITELASE